MVNKPSVGTLHHSTQRGQIVELVALIVGSCTPLFVPQDPQVLKQMVKSEGQMKAEKTALLLLMGVSSNYG